MACQARAPAGLAAGGQAVLLMLSPLIQDIFICLFVLFHFVSFHFRYREREK